MNKLLKTKLREHALVLRDLSFTLRSAGKLSESDITSALRSRKEGLLSEIYGVMSATLGVPPQPNDKFTWDYYDKDGKAGRWEGSAKQFYAVRNILNCGVGDHHDRSLGILEQALPSLRRILSNQRSPQRLLEAVYSGQTWQCLGRKTCPLSVRQIFVVDLANKYLDVNTEIEHLKNAVVKVCFMSSLRLLEGRFFCTSR